LAFVADKSGPPSVRKVFSMFPALSFRPEFPSVPRGAGDSARAFGLFGLLGPVFSVFTNFGHPEMLPKIRSVFPVFLYSVFGLFGPVFGHDHIDQIEKV
jgi:hypothetical protein